MEVIVIGLIIGAIVLVVRNRKNKSTSTGSGGGSPRDDGRNTELK